MNYSHRLAVTEDTNAIATLWQAFAQERATIDPSMAIKPDFDFTQYITNQLANPLNYAWVLEHNKETTKEIVGCIIIYFYDEAPPSNLPQEMLEQHEIDNPFISRRVASVLGLYVKLEHRQAEVIQLLAKVAIAKAEEMQVNDIDLLISADKTGIQALLQRAGFTKAAVQYTKHYDLSVNAKLPNLHPSHPEVDFPQPPLPKAIPLRAPQTGELVRNHEGEPVFLFPLETEAIEASKLPIYPTPIRHPQTQDFIFNSQGELVVSPVLRDKDGKVIEYKGIPQFHPPAYQTIQGKLHLKQNEAGDYIFCEVELDKEGEIIFTPEGQPVFKQSLTA